MHSIYKITCGFLFVLGMVISCKPQKNLSADDKKQIIEMVDYSNTWKTVDSLESQGLIRSALEIVEKIKASAFAEEDDEQIVKSVLYQNKFQAQLEEDSSEKIIERLETDIKNAPQSAKSILHSVTAEVYAHYLQRSYYLMSNRTEMEGEAPEDLRLWSVHHFLDTIAYHYFTSISDKESKQVTVDSFKELLTTGQNADELQPTLYDILVNRAIQYFMNEQSFLAEPVYKYLLNDPAAFGPVSSFVKINFQSKDADAYKLKTLHLFQEALKYRTDDDNEAALLDLDLNRLRYVFDNIVLPNKEELYVKALEDLLSRHKNKPTSTEISYRLAQLHFERGSNYNALTDTSHRMELRKAHEIASLAVKAFPESYGAPFCLRLIQAIEATSYQFEMEQVNLPEETLLASATFKNVSHLWTKTIKISQQDRLDIQRMRNPEILSFLASKTPVLSKDYALKENEDFQSHSMELAVENPGLGTYIIMVSDESDFTSGSMSMVVFHVSRLAHFHVGSGTQTGEVAVTDRQSGRAKPNVTVEFYQSQYRQNRREYELIKVGQGRTNEDGFVQANISSRDNQSYMVKLIDGQDELMLDQYFSDYINRGGRQRNSVTHIFTDRAIYRPGQTVYFKGYLMETDEKGMPSIQSNRSVKFTFYDANYQEKSSVELKSNSYGTVSGSFQIPSGGLTGQMSIRSGFGDTRKYFRVEEYKRPKFEVVIDPVEEQVKLGDVVEVKGHAMNFAGTAVDGAVVRYRVERVRYEPYWRYGYYSRFMPRAFDKMEIVFGEVTTAKDGSFSIKFPAKPEEGREDFESQYYTFTVHAEVIDITGETRSDSYQIRLGDKSYGVKVELDEMTPLEQLSAIEVAASTLNGEDAEVTGTCTISRIAIPGQSYRDRYWQMPDQFSMTKNDFTSQFPAYLYPGEERMENWEVISVITTRDLSITGEDLLDFSSPALQAGAYRFDWKFSNTSGEQLDFQSHTIVYSLVKQQIPDYIRFLEFLSKTTFEPGEEMVHQIGSGLKNAPNVLRIIDRQNRNIDRKWLAPRPVDQTSVQIAEEDRGGLAISHTMILNNRFYSYSQNIQVPWTNKELEITYGTFRDKLLPGQEEEWVLNIKGKKGEQVTAEMMASMYDASLDAFVPHKWGMQLYPGYYSRVRTTQAGFTPVQQRFLSNPSRSPGVRVEQRIYRQFNWFGFPLYGGQQVRYANASGVRSAPRLHSRGEEMMAEAAPMMADGAREMEADASLNKSADENIAAADPQDGTGSESAVEQPAKIRTDLVETAFFFPHLETKEDGSVSIKFKMKESLTRWKFQGLAHSKDLKIGLTENEIVTQKDLMVFPNAPRFFRQGDKIFYTAKVNNVSQEVLNGNVSLNLLDYLSRANVNTDFNLQSQSQNFSIPAGESKGFSWELNIPADRFNPVLYQVVAQAGSFSDGEEDLVPVLSNRMRVTESLPLPVKANETKTFDFKSLSKTIASNTLVPESYTIEYTSNPAWYAVQALPYLMEYPHQCSEQIFSRLYANTLASHIANRYPAISAVFKRWRDIDSDALLSNLSKNQELKSALLEETPWVLDALSEEEQKKNIALLFDLNKMGDEKDRAVSQLSKMQMSNGGFPWFEGGRDNWFISQYILEGFAHLDRLGATEISSDSRLDKMVSSALTYCDARVIENYRELERRVAEGLANWEDDHLGSIIIHYLYTRSFFKDQERNAELVKVSNYYLGQAEQYWTKKNLYEQGLLTLALNRNGKESIAQNIMKSLRERSLLNEELGRYWKESNGYNWNQLPIERQSLMIEVFGEMTEDQAFVDELRVWLLKNKQTNRWPTTKATASAIYALLIQGDNWLASDQLVGVQINGQKVTFNEQEAEPGTGYVKKKWAGGEVTKDFASITVSNPNNHIAWGAAYWQYFEDMDKIDFFEETPLKIQKEIYKQVSSDRGPKAVLVSDAVSLMPGDKLLVRLIIESDRDMEFIHLKDMRASGVEPIDVLSRYVWQAGVGFYQSTKDLATHFFFDYLPRGRRVLEYELRVVHKGDFSNGISSIQSMYAPEFTGHSQGVRIGVK